MPFQEFVQWGWIDDDCVAAVASDVANKRRIVVADLRSGVQRVITSSEASDVRGLQTDRPQNRMYSLHTHYCLVWSLNNLRVIGQQPLDPRRLNVYDNHNDTRGTSCNWVVRDNGEYWPRKWTRASHRLYPARFREAVRALLIIAQLREPDMLPSLDCWMCIFTFLADML